MKTTALVIAIAVALTAPALAASKKSKRAAKPADTMSEAQKTNDASFRLVKGSLPIFLPSWAVPIYVGVNKEQDETAKPRKVRSKRVRAVRQ